MDDEPNMPSYVEILGYVAATFSVGWILPQTVKAIRTRSVGDLEPMTIILMATAIGTWGYYGYRIHSDSVIAANVVALLLYLPLMVLRLSHDDRAKSKIILLPIVATLVAGACTIAPAYLVGYMAAGLNFASTAFQISRSHGTKSVGDISALALGVRITALILWAGYGTLTGATPLIVTNLLGIIVIAGMIYQRTAYHSAGDDITT